MDVAWQDSVGSLLDSSGIDPSSFASFTGGDGTLWSSSGDSPLFSGQSVLWESGPDSSTDSHIGGLKVDSANGTDTSPLLASSWMATGPYAFARENPLPDAGLLWSSAGSDTSSPLTDNGGLALGALDLGATSGASQWQQFVTDYAAGAETWLANGSTMLWTGGDPTKSQTLTTPHFDTPLNALVQPGLADLVHGMSQSLAGVPPAQLVWGGSLADTGLLPSKTTPAGGPSVGVPVSPPGVPPDLASLPYYKGNPANPALQLVSH